MGPHLLQRNRRDPRQLTPSHAPSQPHNQLPALPSPGISSLGFSAPRSSAKTKTHSASCGSTTIATHPLTTPRSLPIHPRQNVNRHLHQPQDNRARRDRPPDRYSALSPEHDAEHRRQQKCPIRDEAEEPKGLLVHRVHMTVAHSDRDANEQIRQAGEARRPDKQKKTIVRQPPPVTMCPRRPCAIQPQLRIGVIQHRGRAVWFEHGHSLTRATRKDHWQKNEKETVPEPGYAGTILANRTMTSAGPSARRIRTLPAYKLPVRRGWRTRPERKLLQ